MGRRLIDYAEPDAEVASPDGASTDPWIFEVLLDTLAVALHLPLRLVITPRFDSACAPDKPLGIAIQKGFGDHPAFIRRLQEITADARSGLASVGSDIAWADVETQIDRIQAVITSNSDPFWTIMRGLQPFSLWEEFWLLADGPTGTEDVCHLPPPFGTDFIVCKAITPKFGFRLAAGPVWHWVSGTCGEPGMAPSGGATADRIVGAFADHIRRHSDEVADGTKAVGIFSEERLKRNVMSRPPMLVADVRRRVRLASCALEHALGLESGKAPKVAELVSIALAALHLVDRHEANAVCSAAGSEIWHRLETGCEEGSGEPGWLMTRISEQASRALSGASILHSGPPPTNGPKVRVFSATSDSADPDELAFSHLMVDYAIGRSAYIRERMMIIRLWARDNFARWLTTPNLPQAPRYTERVDALAYRIADVFVADRSSIFRYDAEHRTLDRLGRFSRDQVNEGDPRAASYDRIRAAGPDQERRAFSPRYQAIDDAAPVHLTKSRDDHRRSGGTRPGSRLVVPIVVFGRPWGAIELVGFRSDQFLPSTTQWLDEFSRLIGQDLYVEGILNDLHEISRSVLSNKTKYDQFRDVIGWLARIFVAGSGTLYLRHPRRTAEYECVAFFGRPGDLPGDKLSGFNIDDPVSKAATILRGERKEWIAGEIGSLPFDGEWPTRAKTKALKDQGFKYIAMMPLRDAKDQVVGCITLAAREGGPFEQRFQPLAEFATRYAGVAIEAIGLKHQPDETVRELMAHSLKTRVDRVMGSADTLQLLLNNFFGEAGDAARVGTLLRDIELEAARHRWPIDGTDRYGRGLLRSLQSAFDGTGQNGFATILADLRKHTADLRHTAAFLAGDVTNPENPFETTEAQWSGTPTTLRDCLLGCVMPVARKRGVEVRVPPPQELGPEVRLRVSPLVMSDMINNFADNALKYSASGVPIAIRFRRRGSSASLEFRNLAPRLTDDEIAQIGTAVFRSAYARSRSGDDGQGKGLISNRRLAERWKMKMVYRAEQTAGLNVWHVFGLEIPGDIIFEDAVQRIERAPRA